jgi:hypothetical protein
MVARYKGGIKTLPFIALLWRWESYPSELLIKSPFTTAAPPHVNNTGPDLPQ